MFIVGKNDTPHTFIEVMGEGLEARRVRIVACSCGVGGVRIGRSMTVEISGKFTAADVFNCAASEEVHLIKITSQKNAFISAGLERNSTQEVVPAPSGNDNNGYWVEADGELVNVAFSDAIPIKDVKEIKRIRILKGSTFGSRQNLVRGSAHDVIDPPMDEVDAAGVWVQGVDTPVLVRFGDFKRSIQKGDSDE